MAIFDLKVNEKKLYKSKRAKIWGVSLIVFCSLVFLTLLTGFVPAIKHFFLGVFGLFVYPLFIVLFCVGVALINNKKYILPIKYLIYLGITVLAVLSLINLIILGNPSNTFFEYLGLSYDFQYTAGGIICALLLAPFLKTIGIVGTAVIFVIVTVIFVALLVDFLNSIKVYGIKNTINGKKQVKNVTNNTVPHKVAIKVDSLEKKLEKAVVSKEEPQPQKDDFNLFEEKKPSDNQVALIKLGLIEGNLEGAKPPEKKLTLREQILTPPEIDFSKFSYKNHNNMKTSTKIEEPKIIQSPVKDEVKKNGNNLIKSEENVKIEQPQKIESVEFFSKNAFNSENTKENENEIYQDDVFENKVEQEEILTRPEPKIIKKFVDLSDGTEDNSIAQNNVETSNYVFPPISLLDHYETDLTMLNEDVVGKRKLLEDTLETFGISAKVIGVVIGPSVTRYELEMPHGVSVKKIISLEDDISLALAARSGIRIEAPIPGKSAVGIEVPNESIATVSLREVLETDLFKNNHSPVTFALGKNISGNAELCNLAKMPHILVAGATNSGKSICLNAIILSMIYKASPDELRLILIDPKRVEFSLYNDLPHLLIPNVITEVDKAVNALLWCVNEMERRFELLSTARCRNSEEYNKMPEVINGEAPKMPYIVVIVDELADLMSSGKKELEEYLRRLTQKARAAGILLVLATQRPSVDVITGVIKTNCPARISFALTSSIDSRTILDTGGAETLLGKGDMLYKPSDAPSARRVQGCYVSAEEVERVVEFVKANNANSFDEKAKEAIDKEAGFTAGAYEGAVGDPNWDPLLPQALKMFIENGQASTSAIQRRFLAGFPRASRIVDQLCQMGYVSQPEGTKPRTVLITMEQFYEKFGREFE